MSFIPDTKVPTPDSAENTLSSQVLGNKSDTVAGDSVVAKTKQIKSVTDGIQSDLDNGTDGLSALKILIDSVQSTVNGIQNNTRLTAAIPEVNIPDTGDPDYAAHFVFNLYDSGGNSENPDGDVFAVILTQSDGTDVTSRLYQDAALTTALATQSGGTFNGSKKLVKLSDGRYDCYYKVTDASTEETLNLNLRYEEGAVAQNADRSVTIKEDIGNAAANIVLIKTVTDQIPDAGAMTSIAQDSTTAKESTLGVPVNTGGTATVSAILGNPSNVSVSSRLGTIQAMTDKIDGVAVNGLTGVSNSLAYKVHEIERHLHSYERWLGLAVTPSGETHRADRITDYTIANVIAPFVVDAGNDAWGSWVQVLGSSDTPVDAAKTHFDISYVSFSSNERAGIYFVQFGFGTSAAQAVADSTFTVCTAPFDAPNVFDSDRLQSRRNAAGTKVWVRCLVPGQNTGLLSFYIGLHEYEG